MNGPASVSVVMPTYNRRERVRAAIEALDRQHVDVPFEIVVVSDGSTDGTDELLRSVETRVPLSAVVQENGGPATARNRGVDAATGELIVFVDDDVVAADGMLQAHVDAHRALGDQVVVVGPMLDPPGFSMVPWVRWEQAMLAKQYAALEAGEYEATARQFYTGNASVRRRHLLAAGGFDPAFRRAEDVELAYRLADRGLTFAYEPSAVGLHHADRSYAAWRSAAYLYGRNDVVFARDRGRAWIYPFMARKYREHHRALRAAIAVAVRADVTRASLIGVARTAMRIGDRLAMPRVARFACSVIYGVEYHVGIRDELGGHRMFATLMSSGTAPTP